MEPLENQIHLSDDYHSHNTLFRYMYQFMLEEEEDDNCVSQESLVATEREFYNALTNHDPSSPPENPPRIFSHEQCHGYSNMALEFIKGTEEGLKFLPDVSRFFRGCESHEPRQAGKNARVEDGETEVERNSKKSASEIEEEIASLEFDRILLYNEHEQVELERPERVEQGIRKIYGNVDLELLLNRCAHAITDGDTRLAFDLLKEIRGCSSLTGNGVQRMASHFADALEIRLTGCTTKNLSSSILTLPNRMLDILKVHQLSMSSLPFLTVGNFFTNKHILRVAKEATRLHIVDFGMCYGFTWPWFIHQLASRPGGPPKLKITALDPPQPGFRPNRRIEWTQRFLENYAKRFGVPLEFHGVIKKWEMLRITDLKREEDEILAVNSMFRFHQLAEEGKGMTDQRDAVLGLIRKMNPAVFILGIPDSAHGSSYFVTRFREAVYYYTSWFDMLNTVSPPQMPVRQCYEDIMGTEIRNAIGLEGPERVERPEKARVWNHRLTKAGFRQLAGDQEIVKTVQAKTEFLSRLGYFIQEKGGWLIQGWKGRPLKSISAWRPE